MTPTNDAPVTVEQLAKAAADAHSAFVTARERMNAAIPALDASPAERAVYDERYRADHAAEREHWRTAIELAQNAHRLAALASAPAGDGVEAMRKALLLARPFVEADKALGADYADADWEGMAHTALEAIDAALARPRAAVGEREALATIQALLGNVDHSRPGGHGDALHRGGLLESVREIVAFALQSPPAKVEE